MKNIHIITGGGSGLGFAIAKKLTAMGENVAIVGRDINKLSSAKIKIKIDNNSDILTFSGDISDEKFVNHLFSEITASYKVVCLYNCAGVGRFGEPENNNIDMINDAISGSLIGLILMSSSAIKYMKDCGGNIINIMSTAALKGNPLESVYCAAKWGARGFTESLKAYTKGSNIKVMGVYPGGMNTDFWNDKCGAKPDTSKFMDADEVAEQIVLSTVKRKSMCVSDITIDRK
ncbi:MAG: SDR family NAD(P)-dependent oxidoreductase [Oscillospiraceae bacterium]|nr:SDR family NAD(P)-dependent oxidoreductase [Oscillospiraceae bacterium]